MSSIGVTQRTTRMRKTNVISLWFMTDVGTGQMIEALKVARRSLVGKDSKVKGVKMGGAPLN